MKTPREKFILSSRVTLLKRRGWAYLRYLHTRHALGQLKDCESLLFVGTGYGFAEVALAAEYPERRFVLTDYPGATHDFVRARELVERGELQNVEFGRLDITAPDLRTRVDAVLSVEVLEHIEDAALAAENMLAIAGRAVFCLVPFATPQQNASESDRARAWRRHEHYVVGFAKADLRALFGQTTQVRGAYWHDAGMVLRERLAGMSPEEITDQAAELFDLAKADLRDGAPSSKHDAMGIKALVRH